jgi:lysyl-tRNA synthetase class II
MSPLAKTHRSKPGMTERYHHTQHYRHSTKAVVA